MAAGHACTDEGLGTEECTRIRAAYAPRYIFGTDKRGDLAIFGDISLHGITSRATSLRIHSTKNYPIRSIFGLGAPIHVWGRPALRASPLPPPTASPHCQRNPRSTLGHSGGPHCQPHCQLSQWEPPL